MSITGGDACVCVHSTTRTRRRVVRSRQGSALSHKNRHTDTHEEGFARDRARSILHARAPAAAGLLVKYVSARSPVCSLQHACARAQHTHTHNCARCATRLLLPNASGGGGDGDDGGGIGRS